MAFTEQDYQEIVARLKRESQGVGDVPNAESLDGITSLPAYQPAEGQDMPRIVRAPLALLAAPALEAARVANEAAGTANEKAQLAQDAADNAYNTNMGIAFTRTNSENMAAPAGGSFENPVPDGPVWTSALPAGMGRRWVSMRKFTSNGINQDAAWSAPANLTYNQYLEFATSTVMDNPGTPDTNPENWVDKGGNGYVWIGIQMVYNGSKKGWNVTRVTPDLRELISSMETSVSSAYSAAAAAGRATADANAAATAANEKVALAAAAAAYVLGLPGKAVEEGLGSFSGAGRRFERKGIYNGAEIYDDYAHHPDELHALLTTAKSLGRKRLIVAFQPHTYSRTAKLFDRFVEELKLADVAVLAEIYAAREQNTEGISAADLCAKLPGSTYCSTLDKVANRLRELAQPGDLILTVGAGDIYRAGEKLLQKE